MRNRNRLLTLAAAALLLAVPPARPQEAERKVTLKGQQLSLPEAVSFEAGADELGQDAEKTLGPVAVFLKEKKSVTLLRVEGHAGADGDAAQGLSEQRALAVARWLAAHGVECRRLVAVGFGATKPAGDGEAGGDRISFVVAGLGGRLIGGMPADGGGKIAGDACEE